MALLPSDFLSFIGMGGISNILVDINYNRIPEGSFEKRLGCVDISAGPVVFVVIPVSLTMVGMFWDQECRTGSAR